jgi:hypothetical protein
MLWIGDISKRQERFSNVLHRISLLGQTVSGTNWSNTGEKGLVQ